MDRIKEREDMFVAQRGPDLGFALEFPEGEARIRLFLDIRSLHDLDGYDSTRSRECATDNLAAAIADDPI